MFKVSEIFSGIITRITFVVSFLLSFSAFSQKNNLLKNDSAYIFGYYPGKPFNYGYVLNKKQCEEFRVLIKDYRIRNRETIAGIGATSGWLEGVLSLFVDSVNFYVQDVNADISNQYELEKAVKYYSSLRDTPQTNKFIHVTGSEKKSNLPDTLFDKIIFNNSFHTLITPSKIIRDLKKKIKWNGRVIVRDYFSNQYVSYVHPVYNIVAIPVETVIKMFEDEGLLLTNVSEPMSSISNVLTFEVYPEKSKWLKERISSIDFYMKDINKLYEKEFCKDPKNTKAISDLLFIHTKELHSIYSTLENTISLMGYYWLDLDKYDEAINVFKINIVLYPNSYANYASVGFALRNSHLYEEALSYYKKAVELEPNDPVLNKELAKVKKILQSMR